MKCDHCGAQVPEGVFCTSCGAHEGTTEGIGDRQSRLHRFAAHPGEHVATPNVFTTLFPHLASHRVHEFRYAFLGGVAVVAILYAFGLIVAGILVAAILVPILYLIYLYEAQVYRDEPALVLGTTMGLGAILGIGVTLITTNLINPRTLPGGGGALTGSVAGYASMGDFILATVVVPLIALAFLAFPAMLLRSRPAFSETADGLVLGVASGLGFSAAETLVRFSDAIVNTQVQTTAGTWIFPLLSTCIFIPLLHGTGAGIIAAGLWRRQKQPRSARLAAMGIPVAVIGTLAFYVVGQWIQSFGASNIIWLGWQAIAVGGLIVYLRFLLHMALLDEATDMGFSPQVCANCHKHVMAAGFCPACGMALSASPRRAAVVDTSTAGTTAKEGA